MNFNKSSLDAVLRDSHLSLDSAWHLNHRIYDDPFASIRPEYLTTVVMAQKLLDDASGSGLQVRLEVSTYQLLAQIFGMHRSGASFSQISRPGKIDLVLVHGPTQKPIVLIENKNRIAGYSDIEDDVVRNKEFLLASDGKGVGCVVAAITTFYWLQKSGMTVEDHDRKSNRSFERIRTSIAKCVAGTSIQYSVSREELNGNAFATSAEAEEIDEETGQRAGDMNSSESLYGGVVALWRADRFTRRGMSRTLVS